MAPYLCRRPDRDAEGAGVEKQVLNGILQVISQMRLLKEIAASDRMSIIYFPSLDLVAAIE